MSNYEYAYQKLMAEHNLKVADLPEDARVGITAISSIEKAMKMAEKQGKKVSDETKAKIKANDKWICQEILDFVEETDDNEDEMPYEEEEVIEEIQEDIEEDEEDEEEEREQEDEEDDEEEDDEEEDDEDEEYKEAERKRKEQEYRQNKNLGISIDSELEQMFQSGKTVWKADEIKGSFKTTYNTLFDAYEDDGDNGIETSNFKLIETNHETFTLSKK